MKHPLSALCAIQIQLHAAKRFILSVLAAGNLQKQKVKKKLWVLWKYIFSLNFCEIAAHTDSINFYCGSNFDSQNKAEKKTLGRWKDKL